MSEQPQEQTGAAVTGSPVSLHADDDAGTVAIGATIDGVFVPFYTLPRTQVDGLVASGKNAQANTASPNTGT